MLSKNLHWRNTESIPFSKPWFDWTQNWPWMSSNHNKLIWLQNFVASPSLLQNMWGEFPGGLAPNLNFGFILIIPAIYIQFLRLLHIALFSVLKTLYTGVRREKSELSLACLSLLTTGEFSWNSLGPKHKLWDHIWIDQSSCKKICMWRKFPPDGMYP